MNKVVLVFAAVALVAAASASASQWKVKELNLATIAFATSFSSNTEGITPVGRNGSPATVLASKDAGTTWQDSTMATTALMYLAGSTDGSSAVVGGLFSTEYATAHSNGTYTFGKSAGGDLQTQSMERIAGVSGGFGATGATLFGGNGVATTTDGGKNFKFSNITNAQTFARYGAFPSATTWYVAAGTWPSTQAQKEASGGLKPLTSRLSLSKAGVKRHAARAQTGNDAGWAAELLKTTDGGATWTSQFYNTTFYFNQISCGSTTNCVAVGEADTSSMPGIRIYTTTDGGATWNETYSNTNPNLSLLAVEFVSETEVWAGGGLVEQALEGNFYHSTDAGMTWTLAQTVKDVYVNDFSFPSAGVGFATAVNVFDQSSFLAFE